MEKVYALRMRCNESQCDSNEELELFERREDAVLRLAEEAESLKKSADVSHIRHEEDSLTWTAGDFADKWWIEEKEVRPAPEERECGVVGHARRELAILEKGLSGEALEMQKLVDGAVLDLVKVFAGQGHSGFSAAYAMDAFRRLADWKPVSALTGEDDEWGGEVDSKQHTQQNRRYPALFRKNHDSTTAYCVDSVIFSDDGGLTWFGCGWMRKMYEKPIVFPWYPPPEPDRIYIRWIDEDARKFEDITYNEDVKKSLREAKERAEARGAKNAEG